MPLCLCAIKKLILVLLFSTGDDVSEKCSQSFESRRRQAMAIVMMGVLGAEFGQEMEPSRVKKTLDDGQKNKKVVEGFEITNYSHARHTSKNNEFFFYLIS